MWMWVFQLEAKIRKLLFNSQWLHAKLPCRILEGRAQKWYCWEICFLLQLNSKRNNKGFMCVMSSCFPSSRSQRTRSVLWRPSDTAPLQNAKELEVSQREVSIFSMTPYCPLGTAHTPPLRNGHGLCDGPFRQSSALFLFMIVIKF